jgi:hypothetical protein
MIRQNFGSGGSASVDTTNGTVSVTTAWTRVTKTITVPSISGKTIGTGNCLEVFLYSFGDTIPVSGTIDIWGVQLEYGSKATPFQTATGTIQGELAACQRYYWRQTAGTTYTYHGLGYGYSTTAALFLIKHPVRMRVVPTSFEYANLAIDLYGVTNYTFTTLTMTGVINGVDTSTLDATGVTGLTANRPYALAGNNNTSNYLGFSAEL